MIDYEFCTGCHACEVACKKHLGLPAGQHGIRVLQDGPREL
ncbi:MAG TPA: 4Fe-4S binding protein, partial [Gordonibacter urolithinfaciens]